MLFVVFMNVYTCVYKDKDNHSSNKFFVQKKWEKKSFYKCLAKSLILSVKSVTMPSYSKNIHNTGLFTFLFPSLDCEAHAWDFAWLSTVIWEFLMSEECLCCVLECCDLLFSLLELSNFTHSTNVLCL
jgi:hypothetical protein